MSDNEEQIHSARPAMEPLTPDEKEAFLARVRGEGRTLTSAEMYAIFGPPPEKIESFRSQAEVVEEVEPALLDAAQIAQLQANFFPELGDFSSRAPERLVCGLIFDFDYTLAALAQPLSELMAAGAGDAEAYMRSIGMTLPAEFCNKIVEARRFAEEKSAEEGEEHLADDAMSFLLQFFGYPASRLEGDVLRRIVDIFYAREMTAWKLRPGASEVLRTLSTQGYKLALMTNYNCDRVFQRTIDYLGIRPFFDLCLSSASIEYRKPDASFFQVALDRWDALPYEVVVVGDSLLHDIQGGINLGALTVHAAFDSDPQVAFDNARLRQEILPDASIDDLRKLPEQIDIWANPKK